MKLRGLIASLALSIGLAAPVTAQQLGIGTMNQGTSGYSMGTAIASVLADSNINALVQPSAGTSAYLPLIEFGELDFGIANAIEASESHKGEGAFAGKALGNVVPAARLFPFRVGIFVRKDSGIDTLADLKGRSITYGFSSQLTLKTVLDALLASGGIGPNDFTPVMVPNVVRGADDFAAGRVDAAFFAMGSGKVSATDAAVGGLKFLPIPEGEAAEAAMKAIVPQSYVSVVEPAPNLAGVDGPLRTMSYDYMLLTGTHVPDEQVAAVIKALHGGKDKLVASFPNFSAFDPNSMYFDVGVPYHPGALAAFKDLK